MTGLSTPESNIYLTGSIAGLFARTATPIIVVMGVNGLFTVVDAYFLGAYVGADALTAVTLMFPLYMLLVALSTLVSNGFASVFARLLGGDQRYMARTVFSQAVQLALVVCAVLIVLFWASGAALSLMAANGDAALAGMGYTYISILILFSPLVFVLSINIAALRSEGLLTAMAAITLMSALLNIGFDYLFIVELGAGVAGSAYGTVLAQLCSMTAVILYRKTVTPKTSTRQTPLWSGWGHWGELLALGAPSSLGYIGLSLSAGLTLYCLQLWATNHYAATAGAFGIITRLMTFSFLPLLGLSMAFQTIAGNNFGARLWARTDRSIVLAVVMAFFYCLAVELAFLLTRTKIGFIFINDIGIAAEIARIIPYVVMTMFVFGPLMMIGAYFQAIGDAPRAALLGLSRTYLFALPLTALLPFWFGEPGIWYAGIVAELLVLALTVALLIHRKGSGGNRWGLLETRV
ncbi:Na+-driven multidrug efflux pump [Hoeflea sp. IMCC20628]|uniref:MATE family efflux transporter n=1 Tax=Hoeflea sp. IMCC20628 TaxID=1620421 RepID=UPI00063AA5A9|nr:MATE family efflux transporter [Hoeflea sp. IMCC20628]AKH99573.1 Na+-driven multidrug efflux pump [Hoeflea sp. IMCC20628]